MLCQLSANTLQINCKKLLRLVKPPSIQSGPLTTSRLTEWVREPDHYFLYYPPVHPNISECQGLSCPLVVFEWWLRCLFCDNIWFSTLVMFFCFWRWRHLFTCPILAAGIVVNKVTLRDGLHQEWFHGNRLGQRSHYFLLLLRTNSFVVLREQRQSVNYVKAAWLYLEICDGRHFLL